MILPTSDTLLPWQAELVAAVSGGSPTSEPSAELVALLRTRGINYDRLTTRAAQAYVRIPTPPVDALYIATELIVAGIPRSMVEAVPVCRGHLPDENLTADWPQVYEAHASGYPPAEIAAMVDSSRPRIYWLLKRRGLAPNPNRNRHGALTAKQRDQVLAAWKAGEPIVSIASRIDATVNQVRYLVRKERDKLLSSADAADFLGVSEGFLTNLTANGHVAREFHLGQVKYRLRDLVNYRPRITSSEAHRG